MENAKTIKNIKIIYTEIVTALLDKTFKFNEGQLSAKALSKFIGMVEKNYGVMSDGRIVDFCVYTAYNHRYRSVWTVGQLFGSKTFALFIKSGERDRFIENKWLASGGLTRDNLFLLIADNNHPHLKYIFMQSEESTKMRMLNKKVGYLLCQSSTLGWSPLSPACKQCGFTSDCKKLTQSKYPEIFRLREEYEQSAN